MFLDERFRFEQVPVVFFSSDSSFEDPPMCGLYHRRRHWSKTEVFAGCDHSSEFCLLDDLANPW